MTEEEDGDSLASVVQEELSSSCPLFFLIIDFSIFSFCCCPFSLFLSFPLFSSKGADVSVPLKPSEGKGGGAFRVIRRKEERRRKILYSCVEAGKFPLLVEFVGEKGIRMWLFTSPPYCSVTTLQYCSML